MDVLIEILIKFLAGKFGDKGSSTMTPAEAARLEEVRRKMAEAMQRQQGVRPEFGPPPVNPNQSRPVPIQPQQQVRKPAPARKGAARQQAQNRPTAQRSQQSALAEPPTIESLGKTITAPPAAQSAKQPVQISAVTLNRWLNPATLRQQFILTEIFQPPVALREPKF